MCIVLGIRPDFVPSPTDRATMRSATNSTTGDYTLAPGITQEGIAVTTWIMSVLFCACVCFGNIGRQLAIGGTRREKS